MTLKTRKFKSLAGTDKQYVEVEGAKGLRVRVMNQEGEKTGQLVRIHVQRDAPEVNSRERDEYFALDVNWSSIIKIASKLFDDAS